MKLVTNFDELYKKVSDSSDKLFNILKNDLVKVVPSPDRIWKYIDLLKEISDLIKDRINETGKETSTTYLFDPYREGLTSLGYTRHHFKVLEKAGILIETVNGLYLLFKPKAIDEAIKKFEEYLKGEGEFKIERIEIDLSELEKLFDRIVIKEEYKDVIIASLLQAIENPERPVHLLFIGPPASGKTLILERIAKIKDLNVHFACGGQTSKAGIEEVLMTSRPRILIIDEVDKIESPAYLSTLLTLAESQKLIIDKYGKHINMYLPVTIYCACNRINRLPEEFLSRFTPLEFTEFTFDEFREVAKLIFEEEIGGVDEKLLNKVVTRLWERRVKDPRRVRDAIRLAANIAKIRKIELDKAIDRVIGIYKSYDFLTLRTYSSRNRITR